MHGWLPLHRLSWRLGLRQLLRRRHLRHALIRLVIPLDPSRYLELPPTLAALPAGRGDRVLDVASPKLAAVALARRGAEVTSVDLLGAEIEAWRAMTDGQPGLRFEVADGRELPYADASFDHAYSISVLEHMPDGGDERALREMARVVRPGGRVLVTLPYANSYHEDWRDRPVYGEQEPGPDGRYFFERWYDQERLARLLSAARELELVQRVVVRMQPNWNRLYLRTFPWLIPLGPFYGLLGRERRGPGGDVVRLELVRSPEPAARS